MADRNKKAREKMKEQKEGEAERLKEVIGSNEKNIEKLEHDIVKIDKLHAIKKKYGLVGLKNNYTFEDSAEFKAFLMEEVEYNYVHERKDIIDKVRQLKEQNERCKALIATMAADVK